MTFTAETYQLTFPTDRPFVYINSPQGDRIAELFVLSSVHPLEDRDDTVRMGEWEISEQPGETIFSIKVESSFWLSKTYRFRCYPRRFTYEIELAGSGRLAEALYFGGYYSGSLRWGSGFFWSGQHFSQVFNPEPGVREEYHLAPAGVSSINLNGVPLPGRDDWFFTPPPFCFAGQTPAGWLALGVQARPGDNLFTGYSYHGSPGAFYLSLAYEGHTKVNGVYRLPALGFDFAGDEYTALQAHVQALQADGCIVPPTRLEQPAWWRRPIFCEWGSQCYRASQEKGRAPDYARQDLCEDALDAIEAQGIDPGTVVVDDKWQATYGENAADEAKWPGMAAFIERQHARGRRVLLWLKAWDPEGLPERECITNAAGLPLAADPTNPLYEFRLRQSVQRMLSPEGYGADGFKVDFTARIPSGPRIQLYGDLWGLELMRRYLSILASEARKVKPDALIMTHTPHPYLADLVDMIRLNDINTGKDVVRAMTHRARVAAIALPHAVIDTDNWPVTDRASWRSYMLVQPQLGVPSLYYSTHIDGSGEPLEADDYRLVRETWQAYLAGLGILEGPVNA